MTARLLSLGRLGESQGRQDRERTKAKYQVRASNLRAGITLFMFVFPTFSIAPASKCS